MKKLLIATVLTAVYGIGGVTFASTNDVQNNNEPIKMNMLVERNHDDANNFQDKKSRKHSICAGLKNICRVGARNYRRIRV